MRATRRLPILEPEGGVWDYPTMILTLDAKRRVSLPSKLVSTKPGDQFDAFYDDEEDEIILRRVKGKEDWLEIMKQCPVPMDDLPPRPRDYFKPKI